jgi:transcription initiation factor TFIIB
MLSTTPQTTAPTRIDRTTTTCPDCGGDVEHTPRESVCADCGLVIDDTPIDHAPDWGAPREGSDTNPQRAFFVDPGRGDSGLGTHIGTATERRDADADRIWTWHNRARGDKRDRNRAYATREIRRIVAALDLSDRITDRATHLWQAVHTDDTLSGQDIDRVTAGCVLVACREQSQGLVRSDLEPVVRCDAAAVTQGALLVAEESDGQLPPPDVAQRTRVVGFACGCSRETVADAVGFVRTTREQTIAGRKPSGVAAAAVWLASDLTQSEVADVAGSSRVTLRKIAKLLRD